MSLFITKISSASSTTTFNYLNTEHVWGLKTVATYQFSVLDAQFDDGTDALLTGIEALELAYSRQNIAAKIGVDEFKNGVVLSISLPESSRVRETKASISIEETKRVDDDGILYDISQNVPSPQDVESFTEDFSFSRFDNEYSYTRRVSLKYKQDTGDEFLNKAYLFLRNIYLNNRPSLGYQSDGISEYGRFNLGLKPLVEENYNKIEKSVSLTESFSSSLITTESGITYSKNQTHSLDLDQDGYTNKVYSVEIKALQEPLENVLDSGLSLSLQSLIDENTGTYGIPFRIEKTINSDGGEASFSVSFSNDPRKNQQTNATYSVAQRRGGEFDEYDFNLEVYTRGFNRNDAFLTSKDYLVTNYNLGLEKIPALFQVTSGDLYELSRNVQYEPFQKSASQSVVYTLDPSYKYEGDGILKKSIRVADTKQVNRSAVLPIYGDSEIIIENENAKTAGTRNVTVDIVSLNSNRAEDGLQIASGEIPPYNYYYMVDKTSNENPLENSVSTSINFSFFD